MMVGHDLDQIGSESPAFGEQASAVTVRESQRVLLGFVQWNLFGSSHLVSRAEFLGQNPEVDDDSQIVKKTCKISFSGIGQIDLACQVAADQRASQRVLPKYRWVQTSLVSRQHLQNAARHSDIADVMKSQADYGSAQRFHLLPSAEQRGVRHLQALRGKGFVLGQKICDFLYVELLDRLIQIAQQRGENRGDGWNLTQSVEPLKQNLFAHGCGCHMVLLPAGERSAFT